MSRILDKVFDVSKKIIRTIFKGSPNLITSSDLNRQMEAFKYQLDQLDDKTGIISDIEIEHSVISGTLYVSYTVSYIEFKGCLFSPTKTSVTINFTKSAPNAYLCLVADEKEVSYEDDNTHEIAGAKFEDGTSMPAANQMVYEDERIVITHALSELPNLIGVLALFTLSETGNVIVKKNTLLRKDSLAMGGNSIISDFDPSLTGKIQNGKTYDEALSILENRFANITTEWNFLENTEISFKIQNGLFYLNLPDMPLQLPVGRDTTVFVALGEFPADKKKSLVEFLKKLNLDSYNNFVDKYNNIPYGIFGEFPVFKSFNSEELSREYPIYAMAKISLILSYSIVGSSYQVTDAFIGAWISGGLHFSSANDDINLIRPATAWESLEVTGYIPRMIGAIPLFGPI